MNERHTQPTIENGLLAAAAERLSRTYAGENGIATEDEVREAVQSAADDLSDARVQTFVPLLAEHKARNELLDRDERAHASN